MPIERAKGVVAETVEGRAVLLRADGLELVTLNETGSVVWDALDTPKDVGELVDVVLARHPRADRTAVESDVRRFVTQLQDQGLAVEGSR
jgi:hypothetical protein